jgi:hypothetical protein
VCIECGEGQNIIDNIIIMISTNYFGSKEAWHETAEFMCEGRTFCPGGCGKASDPQKIEK